MKFGESRKEKALTNDNFFNNHLSELYITQQQNLCLLILIASSPARILIDFLDPLIIAEKIATTERYKFITIDDVTKELRDGKKGVGGIGSNGRMVLV